MHSVVDSCVDAIVGPSDTEQEHRHRTYLVLSLKLKMLEWQCRQVYISSISQVAGLTFVLFWSPFIAVHDGATSVCFT